MVGRRRSRGADDVTIPAGSTVTVTVGQGANTLQSDGTLSIVGTVSHPEPTGVTRGALGIGTSASLRGAISVAGDLSGHNITVFGNLSLVPAASISGTFTNDGTISTTGGNFSRISVNNNAHITVTGSTNFTFGTIINNINGPGPDDGLFEISGAATLTAAGGGGAAPALNNNGGKILKSGGGTATMDINLDINSDGGTFTVTGGSVDSQAFVSFAGTQFNIAAGSSLILDSATGGGHLSGTLTGTGAGQLIFKNGVYESRAIDGSSAAAVLNFPDGYASVDTAELGSGVAGSSAGAIITNTGFLTYTSSAEVESPNLINQGTIRVINGATLNLPAGTSFINDTTGTFTVSSNVNFDGAGGGAQPGCLQTKASSRKPAAGEIPRSVLSSISVIQAASFTSPRDQSPTPPLPCWMARQPSPSPPAARSSSPIRKTTTMSQSAEPSPAAAVESSNSIRAPSSLELLMGPAPPPFLTFPMAWRW